MALPDILFKGVPRQFTRGYTADVIRRTNPVTVFIPCVGAYALATSAVEAGVAPENIDCCDISLYSSVIGAMLSGNDDFRVEAIGRWEWLNEYMVDAKGFPDPIGKVAAVSLGIRLLQYESKKASLYQKERIRELMDGRDMYIQQIRATAERMDAKLGGLLYSAEDMWALMARAKAAHERGDNVIMLCNPPRYSGGYDKMYAGVDDAFSWDEPKVDQFDEEDYGALMRYLADGPRTLLYYATPVSSSDNPADEFGPPWVSVFAARPKSGKTAAINWIITNKPDDKQKLQRSDVEGNIKGKYKLFREGAITPESELRVVVETKEMASYYRDLFVHNLGLVNAERYKVLLLDGKLMAVVGVHLQNLRASGVLNNIAKLTFAFSADHPDYPKLHKLTLMSVVSSWFWEDEISDIEPMPKAVQTTMLSPHPEVKTARGIFKLKDRTYDAAQGQNKLAYYAELVHRTPKETIEEWMRRWGSR